MTEVKPMNRRPLPPSIHHQQGYTLIELGIVMVVLIALVASAFSGGVGWYQKTKVHDARIQLSSQMLGEIVARWPARNTFVGTTKAMLKVPGVTPWGDTWTITAVTATTLTVAYPLTLSPDTDEVGADLAANLTSLVSSRNILSATYDSGTNVLTVVYSII